jgi:hypothetical protein
MSRSKLAAAVLSFAVLGIAGIVFHGAHAEDAKKPKVEKPVNQELRAFMRTKLKASNQILEGLALEDTDLIQEGAKTLAEMSTVEKWRVSQDPMYRQFSTEFTRNANKLLEAAKERNIDRAALRWMDTTMSCIECHRFVRNDLVVNAP